MVGRGAQAHAGARRRRGGEFLSDLPDREEMEEGVMAKVVVVFYSRTGNTEKMAELVAQGARDAGADTDLRRISEVENVAPEDLLEYDGIVVGSPTYYGGMSWELKRLFDDSVRFHGKFAGKVGGAFASSANIGGGNETTIRQILDAMLIHGMVVEGTAMGDHYGPVSIGAPDARVNEQCVALGKRVAKLAAKLC
jgi:NAD(P)H dehydrogenase (quinone)